MDKKDLKTELVKATHRFKRLNIGCIFNDISKGEYFALEMIHHNKERHHDKCGICVSELADAMKVTSPAVSRMLRALEEKELIERSVDKDNRRNTYVVLTEKGEAARLKAEKTLGEFADHVFEKMGLEEVEKVITLWNKMADIMTEELERVEKGE